MPALEAGTPGAQHWLRTAPQSTLNNPFVSSWKGRTMAAEPAAQKKITPELAEHLAGAMDMAPMPEAAAVATTFGTAEAKSWPDGNGKRRHPKDRGVSHGRSGQGAAVTAVHRTSRPQMPHSS
jgi:hypothetical protein